MERYIKEAQQLGLRSIFDPGQQIIRMDHEALRKGVLNAHGLFVNAYEFELLQKHSGLSETQILAAPAFSVITLGKEGARIHTSEEDFVVPIIEEAPVIDPTGVGDAFRAGFLFCYLHHKSMRVCGEMGTTLRILHRLQWDKNHRFTCNEFI